MLKQWLIPNSYQNQRYYITYSYIFKLTNSISIQLERCFLFFGCPVAALRFINENVI